MRPFTRAGFATLGVILPPHAQRAGRWPSVTDFNTYVKVSTYCRFGCVRDYNLVTHGNRYACSCERQFVPRRCFRVVSEREIICLVVHEDCFWRTAPLPRTAWLRPHSPGVSGRFVRTQFRTSTSWLRGPGFTSRVASASFRSKSVCCPYSKFPAIFATGPVY